MTQYVARRETLFHPLITGPDTDRDRLGRRSCPKVSETVRCVRKRASVLPRTTPMSALGAGRNREIPRITTRRFTTADSLSARLPESPTGPESPSCRWPPSPQERTDDQMNAPTQLPSTHYDLLVIGSGFRQGAGCWDLIHQDSFTPSDICKTLLRS